MQKNADNDAAPLRALVRTLPYKAVLILLVSLLCLTHRTLALRFVVRLTGGIPYASQFRINHDSSAILAHDDFLVHFDVELSLWRYFVKASSAGITLHVHNAQTVARVLTYALET